MSSDGVPGLYSLQMHCKALSDSGEAGAGPHGGGEGSDRVEQIKPGEGIGGARAHHIVFPLLGLMHWHRYMWTCTRPMVHAGLNRPIVQVFCRTRERKTQASQSCVPSSDLMGTHFLATGMDSNCTNAVILATSSISAEAVPDSWDGKWT